MERTYRTAFSSALAALLVAMLMAPGLAVAASGAMHDGDGHDGTHGWGSTAWHANQADWSWVDGSRHATGHAWMEWDDCRGAVGLAVRARFQRNVDGHWVTTQTKVKRHHYGWDDRMGARDNGLHFRPHFEMRRGDRTHETRISFTYRWRDAGHLHERHALRRDLP